STRRCPRTSARSGTASAILDVPRREDAPIPPREQATGSNGSRSPAMPSLRQRRRSRGPHRQSDGPPGVPLSVPASHGSEETHQLELCALAAKLSVRSWIELPLCENQPP